jgi:citrate synthase
MMMRPGVEDEVEMNQDMREAFADLKEDMKGAHQETRRQISEFGTKLHAHMVEDAVTAERLKEHMASEEKAKKYRLALWLTTIGAIVTAIAEMVVHHFTKG